MPKWGIHNKWAEQMGIPTEVSNYINLLIDFPEECHDYLDFCAEITKWADYYERRSSKWPFSARQFRDIDRLQSQLKNMRADPAFFDKFCKLLYIGHDTSRSKRGQGLQAHIQLKFLHPRGCEYTKAWCLHHILDYAEKEAHTFSLEEIFERLDDRTKPSREFDTVKSFVRNNWGGILQDLGYDEV